VYLFDQEHLLMLHPSTIRTKPMRKCSCWLFEIVRSQVSPYLGCCSSITLTVRLKILPIPTGANMVDAASGLAAKDVYEGELIAHDVIVSQRRHSRSKQEERKKARVMHQVDFTPLTCARSKGLQSGCRPSLLCILPVSSGSIGPSSGGF
jgi:hypothetical protein